MKNSLKKQLMFGGVAGYNRNPNRIKIKNNVYEISDKLRIKLKIKNILLSIGVILSTFIYRYILDKKFDISYHEATLETWKQGLLLTVSFMLSIVILFFAISYILIPNDLTMDDIRLMEE
ncbi:hypothetical protein [Tissierella praeacuta]|uniref:hypothetical protein n=1 Tax=Tissierella praeacuta TaxID=43131 RepID=UPI00333EB8B8